jgi:hypothetical protein
MSFKEIVKENLLYWFVCELIFLLVGGLIVGVGDIVFTEWIKNGFSIIGLLFIGRGVYQTFNK